MTRQAPWDSLGKRVHWFNTPSLHYPARPQAGFEDSLSDEAQAL